MNDNIVIQASDKYTDRAKEVNDSLIKASSNAEDAIFDICDLLREAHEHQYHINLGYTRFDEWINDSPFDMSPRQALYLVTISNKAEYLNVSRDTMKAVKISKLKEIFSLNESEFSNEINALLEKAPSMSFEDVKAEVKALKQGSSLQEPMEFITIKIPASAKQLISQALQKANSESGKELSLGTALEYICAEYVNTPEGK